MQHLRASLPAVLNPPRQPCTPTLHHPPTHYACLKLIIERLSRFSSAQHCSRLLLFQIAEMHQTPVCPVFPRPVPQLVSERLSRINACNTTRGWRLFDHRWVDRMATKRLKKHHWRKSWQVSLGGAALVGQVGQ